MHAQAFHGGLPPRFGRDSLRQAIGRAAARAEALARDPQADAIRPLLRLAANEAERLRLLDALAELALSMLTASGAPLDEAARPYELALAIIEERFAEPGFNAKQLARQLHCSCSSLHRLFSRHGQHPAHLICERRMALSRRILERAVPEIPISAIAWRCGFASAPSFTKRFRQHFGMPPSLVRREAQATNTALQAGSRPADPPLPRQAQGPSP